MPQRADDNTSLILNMIYERQIKRFYDHFLYEYDAIVKNRTWNLDLYVISASDPTVFLDYASISPMNSTLETIWDPIDLEFWILLILDKLVALHRFLHMVNLDIKP